MLRTLSLAVFACLLSVSAVCPGSSVRTVEIVATTSCFARSTTLTVLSPSPTQTSPTPTGCTPFGPEISTWSLASFLVGPLIVLGLTMIVLGERTEAMMRDAEKKRMKPLGNFIALLCVLAGFGGMVGTWFVLQSMGYK